MHASIDQHTACNMRVIKRLASVKWEWYLQITWLDYWDYDNCQLARNLGILPPTAICWMSSNSEIDFSQGHPCVEKFLN